MQKNLSLFINKRLRLQIAAEVAAPLARTEEIVLLGGNENLSGELTRLVGQVPPAVQALTGVDLSKVKLLVSHFIFTSSINSKYQRDNKLSKKFSLFP